MPAFTRFTLIGRPALVFNVARFYLAAGFIPSVVGITPDGKFTTAARVVDVVFTSP